MERQSTARGGWTYSHLELGSAASPQDATQESHGGGQVGGCLKQPTQEGSRHSCPPVLAEGQ